jgi:hypothetical protein
MRINKKYEALNALADIRETMRNMIDAHPDDRKLSPEIVAKFNVVAVRLGAEADWAKE